MNQWFQFPQVRVDLGEPKNAPKNKKNKKQHKNMIWNMDQKSNKNSENRGPDGPGGVPGEPWEPFWSPKLPRAKKMRKNEGPWLPQPPQKRPKSYDFAIFLLLFYMYFSRHVFLMLPASFFMVLGSKMEGKFVRRGVLSEPCFHAYFWNVFYSFLRFLSLSILRKCCFWCRTMCFPVWIWYSSFAKML